jgi:hypothetical protein
LVNAIEAVALQEGNIEIAGMQQQNITGPDAMLPTSQVESARDVYVIKAPGLPVRYCYSWRDTEPFVIGISGVLFKKFRINETAKISAYVRER